MEDTEVDVQISATKPQPETNSNRTTWSNGQCVVAVPCCSILNPSFDLSVCRSILERDGFQIPEGDLETALNTALNVPSVRRYMVFNSAIFHFLMAPVLYMVVWCAIFSTLHLYIVISDYWVLCLSVSLVSIFLTTAIISILNHSNKKVTVNLDVRLVQVNERMVKYKLLVGVADWVQNCTGNMKLYFVYWDMSHCLRTLTETLEEHSFVSVDFQNKLKSKMSHLVLAAEQVAREDADPEVGRSEVERGEDEQRPLLGNEDAACSTASGHKGGATVTTSYSLVPEESLPAQDKAYQLLMTYSAAYVKLLVSERLSGPSQHRLRPQRNHCTTGPLCLCQYLMKKML